MAATDFLRLESVEGDTAPVELVLDDNDGPVGLAGATVEFRMERALLSEPGEPLIDPAEVVDESAVRGDADYGKVRYVWTGGGPVAGIYHAQFRATFGDGSEATFPTGYIELVVKRLVGT